MAFDLILFDNDGTLVDSETLGIQTLIDFAHELYGFQGSLEADLERFRGHKMDDNAATVAREVGVTLADDFVPRLRVRMAEVFKDRLAPVDGAAAALDAIATTKCVASSGPREKIELTLTITGLIGHFEGRLFSGYELGVWKPDPGLFLHAAAALGVAPSRCAVVEDSEPGVISGLAAGMSVFYLLPPGASAHADADSACAGATRFRHLSELPALLQR